MFGWTGRILLVDVAKRSQDILRLDAQVLQTLLGGKGLAGALLMPEITRAWADPEMPLIFATGPLVGTTAPTSGRMAVASRSPLTGTIGDASVGGAFGTELKRAGWDALVLRGHADRATWVEIVDERVRFHDAREMRGLPVSTLSAKLAPFGAHMCTGPAADHGVLFANLVFDGHYFAGRSGLGQIAAAKQVKAITVRGSGRVAVADPAALKVAREDIHRLINASPVLMGELGITRYGTGALYDLMHSRRMMPTANFKRTWFEPAAGANAHAYEQRYKPKTSGCRGCHINCKKTGRGGERLPEFETMSHFTALLENTGIELVVEANRLCNEAGMDTISAGGSLACYAELEGRRIEAREITSLLADIAAGEGEGRVLGEGAARYASARGRPETAMCVKGMELPAYDPRGAYGMALGYALSTRGACHLRAYPIGHEILRKPAPTDRFSFDGKARIVKIAEDANAVVDSLTACKFVFFGASLEEYAKAYSAVCGVSSSGQDLLALGERMYYAERIMNARNGFDAKDDDLPARFFEVAGSHGNGIEVPALSREDFLAARARYYRIRGLDAQGRPTRERAEALGLGASWPE